MSDLTEWKRVKARKPHWCVDCNGMVPPGAEYQRVKWLDDWHTFREEAHCLTCHQLAADLFNVGVVGEDIETGCSCYPYLPEVDWPDVKIEHPEFTERADAYLARLADPWRAEGADHA